MAAMRNLVGPDINKQMKVLTSHVLRCSARFSSSEPSSPGKILNSGIPDIEFPKIPVHEYVFEHFGKWENHIATKCAVTGRKYSYKEIRSKTNNFGAALRKKLKLNKGEVVTVLLPNVPEFPIAAVGIVRAGLICTTVNPIYTPDEIARQMSDCSPKAIITLNDLYPLAKAAKEILKRDLPIIIIRTDQSQSTPSGTISFNDFADTSCDFEVEIAQEDVAFLPYSSGTTGLPKGVQLTHSNMVSSLCQMSHPQIRASMETTSEHQDVTPAVIPMFHIYGLNTICMHQLRLGCQIVTLPKFSPELFINTLRSDKPDILYVAPPIVIFMANHPGIKQTYFDKLRVLINSAASLGKLDSAKFRQRVNKNIPIRQGYGLTETSPAVLFNRSSSLDEEASDGSLGKPVPNTEVKIIGIDDSKGTPLGPNEQGELLVRGPQVMKGYFNRSEENVFLDGWFKTGDLMYYNEKGYFFITERLKELIKVKGFQVAPAELEEIIRSFPSVAEAAVIGIPHEQLGEAPKTFVVPQEGAKVDCEKLMNYVKNKVAPYKQLVGGVSVVDSIPKNPSGKILRRELRLQYQKLMKSIT